MSGVHHANNITAKGGREVLLTSAQGEWALKDMKPLYLIEISKKCQENFLCQGDLHEKLCAKL